jgi:RNA polymerase sigma-70 factor, ECF subfamily
MPPLSPSRRRWSSSTARRRRLGRGPAAGLGLLEPLPGDSALGLYQPLPAAHAELLSRAGDAAGDARAYERAITLTANAVERTKLERRLGALRIN